MKDTSLSLSDPHKAYLLRKAVHYFNTRLLYRPNIDNYPTNKPIIQVQRHPLDCHFHSCAAQLELTLAASSMTNLCCCWV